MKKNNPLITFAVISYNQERFIAEAVQSALAQTYSPLEVVISDDCSSDTTFEVIQDIIANYNGPHKVILNKNHANLGLAENVNKIWELSSGELVVFQGGDDASVPHRTERLVAEWQAHDPQPDLIFSGVTLTNEFGNPIGQRTGLLSHYPRISEIITGSRPFAAGGCAAAYSRPVHFFVGPLRKGVIAEDFVYSFRALLGKGIIGIPDQLVMYRQHSQSIIGELRTTQTQNIPSKKFLQGQFALLLEYKRAMIAHGVKSFYLRWRLNRRIASTRCELNLLETNGRGFLSAIFWATATFRPRFLYTQLKRVFT